MIFTAYLYLRPVYQGLYIYSNFAFHYLIIVKQKQRTTFDYIIHKEETNNVFQIIHKLSNGMKVVIEKVSPEQNAYATVKQPQNASVNYVDVCIVYLQNVRTLKLQLFLSSFTGGAILLRSTSSCLWSIY